ncbi:hypothetical protein [Stutzerimonas chloritidismutans]|uniref:hypothetical protein n=1 Tax=Stutzerimonas chloritidismutans TaxID=203192 RepID=UPI00384D714A
MPRKLRTLAKEFPFICNTQRLTLHTSFGHSKALTQQIYETIRKRSNRKQRVKTKLSVDSNSLFLKSSAIDSWKSKVRITLGIQRAKKNGSGYDWPLEELLNTIDASKLNIPSASIRGFGYIRHKLGWITEFFLLTEHLSSHIDGEGWLASEGNDPKDLISRALSLLLQLHKSNFIHLDPWVANFMVDPHNLNDIRIVDLENCILAPTRYFQETIGMQFGILYRRTVCDYVTEEYFDELVKHAVSSHNISCDDRFWSSYTTSKREKIARKSRRKTPLTGKIISG